MRRENRTENKGNAPGKYGKTVRKIQEHTWKGMSERTCRQDKSERPKSLTSLGNVSAVTMWEVGHYQMHMERGEHIKGRTGDVVSGASLWMFLFQWVSWFVYS